MIRLINIKVVAHYPYDWGFDETLAKTACKYLEGFLHNHFSDRSLFTESESKRLIGAIKTGVMMNSVISGYDIYLSHEIYTSLRGKLNLDLLSFHMNGFIEGAFYCHHIQPYPEGPDNKDSVEYKAWLRLEEAKRDLEDAYENFNIEKLPVSIEDQ